MEHGDNPQERDCECIRPRNLDRSRTFTSTIALIVIASLANVHASLLAHANQVSRFLMLLQTSKNVPVFSCSSAFQLSAKKQDILFELPQLISTFFAIFESW